MIWTSGARGIALVLLMGLVPGGCRKAEEDEGTAPAARQGTAKGGVTRVPTPARPRKTGDEPPSKLSREAGRHPDGRKAPAPSPEAKHPVAAELPGKSGYVLNPYTNNPVDVQGIPPGTLVRDPGDPDKNHMFRIPETGVEQDEDGKDGDLSEIPVPEIPGSR